MASMDTQLVVLGAGPGGYSAAFRAADLGLQVTLVERYPSLGGVCLNVGCIPSKALLHTAKAIGDAREMEQQGVRFGKPKIDLERIIASKTEVVNRLTGGLAMLAKQRKVRVVQGAGEFQSATELLVTGPDAATSIRFEHAIIATGSSPIRIPGFPYADRRLMDSTGALQLTDIPKKLLVVGGGYIGLELATVYNALGSDITVVEFMDGLLPGADPDLVKPLAKRLREQFGEILCNTKVVEVKPLAKGLLARLESAGDKREALYDRVLVAVGRTPNSQGFGAERLGLKISDRGFIEVDAQLRTNLPHIFAIGDVVGNPMLAHKAVHEGKVAAEVIAGHRVAFAPATIPAVVFTDPEVAWAGLTETEAKARQIAYQKTLFPWAANGRALTLHRAEGLTKILFEPGSNRILGVGITGCNAGDLIAEAVLAIEMGADADDLALTIHAHPTLSETVAMAAEMQNGSVTDIFLK